MNILRNSIEYFSIHLENEGGVFRDLFIEWTPTEWTIQWPWPIPRICSSRPKCHLTRSLLPRQVVWLAMSSGVLLSRREEKFSANPRVEIHHSSSSSGVDSFILTLKDVTKEDEGLFMCQINTEKPLQRNYTFSIVGECSIESVLRRRVSLIHFQHSSKFKFLITNILLLEIFFVHFGGQEMLFPKLSNAIFSFYLVVAHV